MDFQLLNPAKLARQLTLRIKSDGKETHTLAFSKPKELYSDPHAHRFPRCSDGHYDAHSLDARWGSGYARLRSYSYAISQLAYVRPHLAAPVQNIGLGSPVWPI